MFTSIWDDIKQQFKMGNMITRIILVNIAVFVIMSLVLVFSGAMRDVTGVATKNIMQYLSMNESWLFNLTHLWVLITHMFLHIDFWHILWNMILLYWFGRIIGDLIGDHRILPLYLLGGLVGALAYFMWAQIGGGASYAYGASAAVMAVMMTAGVIAPDYVLRLILIGDVKLKYVVAVFLFLDVLGVGGMDNTGGHVAHLGGALFGYLFATQLQNGNDLSNPVNNFFEKIRNLFSGAGSSKKRGPRMAYKNPKASSSGERQRKSKKPNRRDGAGKSHQERLDSILDKIKQTGYDSLTEEEKEFLFNASKK